MNRVVLVGRLTRDPELRNTNSGVPVVSFTIAVNRTFTSSQSGEREADFINCICFNKQAENLNRFIKKGGLVGVDGRIQTGSYDGADGKKVYTTDVIIENFQFLDTRGSRATSSNESFNNDTSSVTPYDFPTNNSTSDSSDPFADFGAKIEVSDSELPF